MACRYVSVLRRVLQFGIFIRLVMVSNFDQKAEWGDFFACSSHILGDSSREEGQKKRKIVFCISCCPLSGPSPL